MPRVVKNVDCLICKGLRDSRLAKCKKCEGIYYAANKMRWCDGILEFSYGLLADGYSHDLVRHMLKQTREKQFRGKAMAKVIDAGERKCSKCGVTKSLDKMSGGGKTGWCKDCSNERGRKAYRKKHGPIVYQIKIPENFCRHCSQWKEATDFDLVSGRWGTRKDGSKARKTKCRKCDRVSKKARDNNRRARERDANGSLTKDAIKMRFNYYGNKCKYCGDTENLHAEHQIPLSRGGANWPSNIAPACAKCNREKATMTNAEYLEFRKDRTPFSSACK